MALISSSAILQRDRAVRVQNSHLSISSTNHRARTATTTKQNLGRWTQKLTIYSKAANAQTPQIDNFIGLLSHLPNLKTINLTSRSNYGLYLNALLTRGREYLKCLQEISKPPNTTQEELYFLTCYQFRETLTHLNFRYLLDGLSIQGRSGNCLRFLADFNKLTHLSIDNYKLRGDLVMISILNDCPNLVSFRLKSADPTPDIANLVHMILTNTESRPVVRSTTINSTVAAPLSLSNLNLKTPYSFNRNLKHLTLRLPCLTTPYMQYMISYIPTQLDSFKLVMDQIMFNDWISNNDQEIVMQFANRLSQKNLEISINNYNMANRTHQPAVRSPRNAYLETQMTRYWSFVSAVKGKRNLSCHTTFRIAGAYKCFEIKVQESKGAIQLRYEIDPEEYLLADGATTTLPFFASIPFDMKGPEMINSLYMYYNNGTTRTFFQMLDYAFNNCQRLTNLNIKPCDAYDVQIASNNPYNKNGSTIIKHTTNQTLHQLPSNRNHLTRVKLDGVDLSSPLLNCLINFLPNIKTLSLLKCKFSEHLSENDIVVLDFRNIAHLDLLVLELTDSVLSQYNGQVYLQFEINEKTVVCYKSVKLPPKYKYDLISKEGKVVTMQSDDKYNFVVAAAEEYLDLTTNAALVIVIQYQTIEKVDIPRIAVLEPTTKP